MNPHLREERNMKPEEAIDIIKRMYKGTPTTEQYEALEAAYEALGKQIPKETPRIYGAMGEKYECPKCGSGLRDTDLFAGYCKWCGQAIKQYGIDELVEYLNDEADYLR